MGFKTEALVAKQADGKLHLEEVTLDDLQPDEALVEIHACGICRLELSLLSGKMPVKFPKVMGHEGGGIVKEVGSAIKGISPGDKVVLGFTYCEKCDNCTTGHPAYCDTGMPRNWAGLRPDGSLTMKDTEGKPVFGNFFGQSSFARHAIVASSCLVKVPDDAPLDILSPLVCGVSTGAGAIFNTLDVKEGSSVAVFGAGAVGMAAIMAAKVRGAKTIIAVDIDDKRLETAKELGATHTFIGNSETLKDDIIRLVPPLGVARAVDTSGVPKIIEIMTQTIGNRGKAAIVGAPPPGTTINLEVFMHLTKGRELVGCVEGDADPQKMIPYLIELYNSGKLPLEKVVQTYPAEDVERAMDDMRSGKTIKPVLVWKK